MAIGNKHLGYKEALNGIERDSPGSKAAFYFGFLERASALFAPSSAAERGELQPCTSCGAPTTGEVCAFCRLSEQARAHPPVPVPAPRVRRRSGDGRPVRT